MHNDPLLQILILLAASVFVVAGVRKLALPAILGYLVVDMLLGPNALALAVENETPRLLAETEFRHQLEATIRSYRDVLLGLFFITIGMLLDFQLLLHHLVLVIALLVGMLLLKAVVARVIRTVNDIRGHRYSTLRQYFPAEAAEQEVHNVILPPDAWALGRSIAELTSRGSLASVSAVRRDGIAGREPTQDAIFKEGDVVVVCGTPDAVEHSESLLVMG